MSLRVFSAAHIENNNKLASLLLLFLFSIYKLDGFITDSKSLGLEMANVMALNSNTKAMDAYDNDDKGKFSLNLKANNTL
jgi:hypothetical protein